MNYADIHTHILTGVDDGAKSRELMHSMLESAYNDGTRIICCTPHYHPGYYGNNAQKSYDTYLQLCKYAEDKFPDLQLFLGNELHYDQGCCEWIDSGECRTINSTRYILVDFDENDSFNIIDDALMSLLNRGYIPILAHLERYKSLKNKLFDIIQWHEKGVIIQINAQALKKSTFSLTINRLLRMHIIDIVASDMHNTQSRPPSVNYAYNYTAKKFGERYAKQLFYKNPKSIIDGKELRKEQKNG